MSYQPAPGTPRPRRQATPRMPRLVLFSLHPHYAAAIYNGSKGFEFRRVRTAIRPGDRALIYETAPVSRVTGEFMVGHVLSGELAELLYVAGTRAGPGVTEYLAGANVASAIEILSPTRWPRPLGLEEAGLGQRPPLSYRFVRTGM
jgi:predicted transcriptional regulator